ncbi:MAG: phosphatase PAP2 family protein [Cytophagia bacterium]|nr:MAG: phosphatase PAP2 family protein [Runella sp.]TAG22932.1 MAG: phosphatase PAP2 family protein [Cytophagales bacterium]TAG41987.1 MAG: phosphatase PAP2 family protein [Cytophagia bacterium]TAG56977.1 MAG: phosphatase PAP2 family protein [Runella slithyformis]TAG82439.1 MAG: phosphatase PAP2 family protein [Cytophagales bacterium]
MRKQLLKYRFSPKLAIGVLLVGFYGCRAPQDAVNPDTTNSKDASTLSAEVATKWAEMDLKLIRTSAGFSPPVAARSLGYAGLVMYEAAVPGMPKHRSLAGQLNNLKTLPQANADSSYHWAASVNAAQAAIARNIWANAPETSKRLIDSLETVFRISYEKEATKAEIERSVAFGKAIAAAIFEWSKTDGGHEGYNRNFPANYVVPVFPGAWQPTENGKKIPMQPYWGKNRTFLVNNSILPPPVPLAISTNPNSVYFKQYQAVYVKNKALTQVEKEIAVWWADDPSETFTPPGHSYNIAKIAVESTNSKLDVAVEAFARTGIAVSDAFVNCWKCKYMFNNERPYTFVRRAIDPFWVPFWPAPPFPGYVSGHATQSAATGVVLSTIFGENFAFTDNSHVGRVRDTKRGVDFKARSYKSLMQAAEESALSRFLGGIHTMQDNDTGLLEGKKVGANINALRWKK